MLDADGRAALLEKDKTAAEGLGAADGLMRVYISAATGGGCDMARLTACSRASRQRDDSQPDQLPGGFEQQK